MKKISATVFAILLTGAAYAESVPARLMDQFNDATVRAERNAIDAASDATARAQREATERANREMIERQNREAYERAQREASERAQREAQERMAQQQRAAEEQKRQLYEARRLQLEASRQRSQMQQSFTHQTVPNHQYNVPNGHGGTTTITNGPAKNPQYPNHRFENVITRDSNGDRLSKESFVYDVHGNVVRQ